MGRLFDGQQDLPQRVGDIWMQGPNMSPSYPIKFNVAPIGASDKEYHTR